MVGAPALADGADAALPAAFGNLSRGNARAALLARNAPLARSTYAHVTALARTLDDAGLRESLLALIDAPQAEYAVRHPSAAARSAVRDELARAGFVAADAPVSGLFPPGTEPGAVHGVQPFWSTPGSGEDSHHAYPGGLAIHEYFNASIAVGFAQTYDRLYFDRATIDRDTVVAAALYHDIMKTVVFQWHDDGTLFDELSVAGTGAHHILSGAEAIARGCTPRFVTTLLSAHAAPSLGDEAKVAAWCKAAAIVAGVDPVDVGLLAAGGTLAASPVPTEAFVSYLSDHDYVLSIHAAHVVGARLKVRYERIAVRLERPVGFPWYRAAILAHATALALYDRLARRGADDFERELTRLETVIAPDLAQLVALP